MMGILITDKLYLDFMCKHRITPTEFYVLYLVYHKDIDSLARYNQEMGGFGSAVVGPLIEKGYLLDFNMEGEKHAVNYVVSDQIADSFFIDLQQAGDELWRTFPPYIYVDGRTLPGRSADKDELIKHYADHIGSNRIKHRKIMELLRRESSAGRITMGIEKWVKSCQWETLMHEEEPSDQPGWGNKEV